MHENKRTLYFRFRHVCIMWHAKVSRSSNTKKRIFLLLNFHADIQFKSASTYWLTFAVFWSILSFTLIGKIKYTDFVTSYKNSISTWTEDSLKQVLWFVLCLIHVNYWKIVKYFYFYSRFSWDLTFLLHLFFWTHTNIYVFFLNKLLTWKNKTSIFRCSLCFHL